MSVQVKEKQLANDTVEYYFINLQEDGSIEKWIKENPENRVINKGSPHIKRIANNLRKYGYIREKAMIVDSDYVLKSGHHRFNACKMLEVDENKGDYRGAWILIDDNFSLQEATEIDDEVARWKSTDWIVYYARQGNEEYKKIMEFVEANNLGIKAAQSLLLDCATQSSAEVFMDIKKGEFKVKDWGLAHGRVGYLKSLAQYLDKPEEWRNVHLVTAIQKLFKTPGFDPEVLVRKISKQTRKFRIQRNRRDMLEVLQDIYNYMRKDGHKIRII